MKRRTLDILFSAGGAMLAVLLVVVGIVFTNNANFAKSYVHDQLAAQQITFKAADTLTDEERRAPCLVANAGKPLVTGKQAECYANEFIGLHVKTATQNRTYAQLGAPQSALRAQIEDAKAKNAPNVPELEEQLADITATRETAFKGETLRGLLLTSFGFSEFGRKGGQAATAAYAAAALLALLSAAGFVHAFRTPANRGFAVPEQARDERQVTTV